MRLEGWEYIGYAVWTIAAVNVFFLVYTAIKDVEFRRREQENYHLAELTKLDSAKTTTKVVVEKTALEGNYFSQAYIDLKIAPAKLKIFATQVLNGVKGLTIREWTPQKTNLFSDPEWRRLIAFMKQPLKDRPDVKFILPINPNDEHQGYELTRDGRKWLENIADVHVLAPSVS
jgi:O-succinylbenzoate synthase